MEHLHTAAQIVIPSPDADIADAVVAVRPLALGEDVADWLLAHARARYGSWECDEFARLSDEIRHGAITPEQIEVVMTVDQISEYWRTKNLPAVPAN